ncbi:HDOD domain-containing protein [Candidatus Hydrogenedentota bacterium]
MSEKKRILFVDDEPNVLSGLQRMLRTMRNEWAMFFVESGQEALGLLGDGHVDIIVSDMRMPAMDGAELLSRVSKEFPRTVRIVLSGQAGKETVFRAIGPTHQYLSKPCDADTLKSTLIRACAMSDILGNDRLVSLVSKTEQLPTPPVLYEKIVSELESGEPSVNTIGELVAQDVAMSAKILQLVNSAFFGLPRQIASASQAVIMLGLDTIKALVFSIHVFSELDPAKFGCGALASLWQHSMLVGACAKRIAKLEGMDGKRVDEAFMIGVLHDVGKLILAANVPEEYKSVAANAQAKNITWHEAEHEVLGATHAEVGAYLLGLWGFTESSIMATAFHHRPGECSSDASFPLAAIHAANVFVQEGGVGEIDGAFLKACGFDDRIPAWRDVCDEIVKGAENDE